MSNHALPVSLYYRSTTWCGSISSSGGAELDTQCLHRNQHLCDTTLRRVQYHPFLPGYFDPLFLRELMIRFCVVNLEIFLKFFFENISPFCWATDTHVLNFSSGFQSYLSFPKIHLWCDTCQTCRSLPHTCKQASVGLETETYRATSSLKL